MNSTLFVALAAGVDETQMAIASTGFYLAGNIGALIVPSAASNILYVTLRQGLKEALKGVEGQDEVGIAFRWGCIHGVWLIVIFQIIEKAVSNLGYVNSLEGGLRDVVVACYIRSFEYTHCKSWSVVTHTENINAALILVANAFASHVVGLCGAGIPDSPHYESTPSVNTVRPSHSSRSIYHRLSVRTRTISETSRAYSLLIQPQDR